MIDDIYKTKFIRTGIYIVVFTLLFMLFFATLEYTLPFVIGLVIASIAKNANRYIQNKLKISSSVSSLIITAVIYAVLIVIILILVYTVTSEIITFIYKIPSVDKLSELIQTFLIKIGEIIGQIDPQVVTKIYEYLQTLLSSAIDFGMGILNGVLSIILSLPSMFLILVISFLATYFFSKDYVNFSEKFYSIFSEEGQSKMRSIINSAVSMTVGYAKAYLLVVFITFVQTFIGFLILGIDYALILAIACALLDVLPIVGTIIVYIPLIIYNLYIGNTLTAIGLIVIYLIVTVVRQVIEPKIVSHSLDLHPILTLAAIFIGLKVNGVVGMIYFIALLVGFKVLAKVKVI